jgi:hypothetical protein
MPPVRPAVRERRARSVAVAVAAMALALALAAGLSCFSPLQPACAFSCAVDHLCPASYTCADDGFCHRSDGQGICLLGSVDAAPDAGVGDGGGGGS